MHLSSNSVLGLPKVAFPEWLEDYRASDVIFENAYNEAPLACRAALKGAIAIAAALQPSPATGEVRSAVFPSLGQSHEARLQPAATAVVLFEHNYAPAARICAACIAPLLAGVGQVAAISVGGSPSLPACLALELCGIGDVFCLDAAGASNLIGDLRSQDPGLAGLRFVFLHGCPMPRCLQEQPEPVAVYQENKLPDILAEPGFDPDLLRFMHGAGCLRFSGTPDLADAVFTLLPEQAANSNCRLILGSECEGYWHFADLPRDFFTSRQLLFSFDRSGSQD